MTNRWKSWGYGASLVLPLSLMPSAVYAQSAPSKAPQEECGLLPKDSCSVSGQSLPRMTLEQAVVYGYHALASDMIETYEKATEYLEIESGTKEADEMNHVMKFLEKLKTYEDINALLTSIPTEEKTLHKSVSALQSFVRQALPEECRPRSSEDTYNRAMEMVCNAAGLPKGTDLTNPDRFTVVHDQRNSGVVRFTDDGRFDFLVCYTKDNLPASLIVTISGMQRVLDYPLNKKAVEILQELSAIEGVEDFMTKANIEKRVVDQAETVKSQWHVLRWLKQEEAQRLAEENKVDIVKLSSFIEKNSPRLDNIYRLLEGRAYLSEVRAPAKYAQFDEETQTLFSAYGGLIVLHTLITNPEIGKVVEGVGLVVALEKTGNLQTAVQSPEKLDEIIATIKE